MNVKGVDDTGCAENGLAVVVVLPKRLVVELVAGAADGKAVVAPKGDGLNEDVPPKSDDVVVPNFLFDR